MRALLLISTLFFISFAQAQDKQPLTLKAELIITGEIVESSCEPNLSKSGNLSSQQIIKTLSDNCTIKSPGSAPVSRVKVASFKPSTANKEDETLNKYSFFISEYM